MRRRKTPFVLCQKHIVYGPVESRRLGSSLGINLFPGEMKVCAFRCDYCFLPALSSYPPPAQLPGPNEVVEALATFQGAPRTRRHLAQVNFITFSGNGEPTCHPEFPDIVSRVIEWKRDNAPECHLALFTNATMLDRPGIMEAILRLDKVFVKYDWSSQDDLDSISHPITEVDFAHLTAGIASLCERARTSRNGTQVVLQTAIYEGQDDHSRSWPQWAERVRAMRPSEVQLYELDFPSSQYTPVPHFDFLEFQRAIYDLLRNDPIVVRFFCSTSFYVNVDLCYAVDSAIYLPLYTADCADLFEEHGVRVNHFVSPDGDRGAVAAVVNGAAQFALCDPQAAIDYLLERPGGKKPRSQDSPVLVAVVIDKVALWALSAAEEARTIREAITPSAEVITYPPGSTANYLWYWQRNRYPGDSRTKRTQHVQPGDEFLSFSSGRELTSRTAPCVLTADILGVLMCQKNCKTVRLSVLPYATMGGCARFLFTGLLASREVIERFPGAVDGVRQGLLAAVADLQDDAWIAKNWATLKSRLHKAYGRSTLSRTGRGIGGDAGVPGMLDLALKHIRDLDIYSADGKLHIRSLINALKVRQKPSQRFRTPSTLAMFRWLDRRVASLPKRVLLSVIGPLGYLIASRPFYCLLGSVVLAFLTVFCVLRGSDVSSDYRHVFNGAAAMLGSVTAAVFISFVLASLANRGEDL